MNITILGAAGFIGTNLTIKLAKDYNLTLVDRSEEYFGNIKQLGLNVKYKVSDFSIDDDYDTLLNGCEILYHLVSTTMPTTSNQYISDELISNVVVTSKILEACVRQGVKKVVFISSGGTVYGKDIICPIKEDAPTNPISSYGVQKLYIEKLLYLYRYMYGLDYRVIRLSNPYGPYQRPNGMLGVVTTFTYKAYKNEEIIVYGDGSVIRDFIYIDDAIKGIVNIEKYKGDEKIFNLGQGVGTSINQVIEEIKGVLNEELSVKYIEARSVDVPVNFLDISCYEKCCGDLEPISLKEGIKKTLLFLKENYG